MIVELGAASSALIRVTAEYSNAVLVAVLPYVSDVGQKLDLPVPQPLTAEHVITCSIKPTRKLAVLVGIKGGWFFAYEWGYVRTIQGPHDFFTLQNPDRITEFYGDVKMSKPQAVEFARNVIRKLGVPLESVFAEQEPRVTEPMKNGANTVPHYRIEWLDPRGAGIGTSVDMDINANAKRLERLRIFSKSLERPTLQIPVAPEPDRRFPPPPQINPEYVRQLIPITFEAIDRYCGKLSLPTPRPLTTNHVARFSIADDDSKPHCQIELTNGWRFVFEGNMVTACSAPDALFGSENYRGILIKDFLGKWNLSETQAIALVHGAVAKLGYPTNQIHMDFSPQISKPALPGIPRYLFRWDFSRDGEDSVSSAVCAEVDAEHGVFKSLYYGDMAYREHRPKIDAPILVPSPWETSQPLDPHSSVQAADSKRVTRAERPFERPKKRSSDVEGN